MEHLAPSRRGRRDRLTGGAAPVRRRTERIGQERSQGSGGKEPRGWGSRRRKETAPGGGTRGGHGARPALRTTGAYGQEKGPPRTARRAFWDVQSCGSRDQTVPMPNTPMTMKYRTMGKMMREMIFRPRPHFIMSFREISPVP